MPAHIVVSISGHGFGHVAQTAPVLNALHQLLPQLRITVRSSAPAEHLRSRIHAPFNHLQSLGDIGMVMSSALIVDVEKSRASYQAFHADWDELVATEARTLEALQADMVFSNVGYLALAGAQAAGIKNAAMCSLNWADIYRHYCGDDLIASQIRASYAGADAFLRTTPGMAMSDLSRLMPVEPIAATGQNRRDELNRHLGLAKKDKLVLVSMGGINSRVPVEDWPMIEGLHFVVQARWLAAPETDPKARRKNFIAIESIPMSFGDLLASCDALVCKPGYGSFVEAVCCGIPVLYVGRPGWPETPALTAWLQQHGLSLELSHDSLLGGNIHRELKQLWGAPKPEALVAAGASQVAAWIAKKLG